MSEQEDVSNEIETAAEEAEVESADEEVVEETESETETSDEGTEEEATDENDGDESGETEDDGTFKPNVKFKVGEKEMEIPQEFHGLMTDEASERKIRDLFERAEGIDLVKGRLNEMKEERNSYRDENRQLHASIGKARSAYQKAATTGNWHRLDEFFSVLKIPQEHIMNYAVAKAQLNEMPPEQRAAYERELHALRENDRISERETYLSQEVQERTVENKRLQLDAALASNVVAGMAKELEAKFGREGIFRDEVIAAGEQAYFSEGRDISVTEAVQRVITKYGLKGNAQANPNPAPTVKTGSAPNGGKKVVQRTTQTIPNVHGSTGVSPVKKFDAPRSIEDIKKLGEKAARGEQI